MTALHSVQSWIASVQFFRPLRSSLTRSHQRKGAPPGGRFFPLGLLHTSCHCGRRAGILQTCPNHCSLLCCNWSSIDCSLVISRMVYTVSNSVPQGDTENVPEASYVECLELFRVNPAPYSKTGITSVWKARCPCLECGF